MHIPAVLLPEGATRDLPRMSSADLGTFQFYVLGQTQADQGRATEH